MGIGLGVVLLVLGLILVLGVVPAFDFAGLDEMALGWIFLVVGALAIVLALVMNKQRSETRHVEERRYQGGPH
ncbi:MAG TPA: DUF6458 family protein [Nocardioidaceae bacterium]|nr:DUF6458 family protein [Nocardioidaceae bacterium]